MIAASPNIDIPIPIGGHGPQSAETYHTLNDLRIARAAVAVMAAVTGHLIAVQHVHFPGLSRFQQNVRVRSGLILRYHQHAARADIGIGSIKAGLVVGCEVIGGRGIPAGQTHAHDAVAGAGVVTVSSPLPVAMYALPSESAERPAPEPQIPLPLPFGEVFQTPVCASGAVLKARIHPCHDPLSPCEAKPIYTYPPCNRSPGR